MADPKFKVIIAGGSIAGLVLANMLEQLGIDFLVLEAYPEIAPQVGASIGFFPNGCRVLDQIGCFDGIRAKLDIKMTEMYIKSPEGKVLGETHDASKHFIARHGYDPVFIDRQMAIQVFYDHLQNKSKVLTDKRVASVKQLKDGIEVTTKDGSTYTGDILVGADGVHSTVRKEMWRLADELSPGYIPKSDQTDVTCDYTCMFGISHPVEGFEKESSHMITNHGRSYLVVDGPGGRIYWFLFLKNERTLRNMEGEIPRRFSKQEEKALAEKCWDDVIMEGVKFGDLYKSQMSAVLTALPEFVCTKWHFGRIFLAGDSVHKFNPISGQGGNSAIETAAALATEIITMLKSTPSKTAPTDAAITAAFQRAQDARHARVSALVEAGHKQQAFMAFETPLHEFIARQVVPRSPPEGSLAMFAQSATGAARLPMLPMPRRPRFEPYDDELPAQPLGAAVQAVSWKVGAAVFAGLLAVAKMGMRIDFDLAPTETFLNGAELRKRYTGIGPVDGMLALLSACFGDSVYGEDPSHPAQFAYLLALLFPVLIIWTVEGYRAANRMNILGLPVLFGIAYQLQGIGAIAPLYFLLSTYLTSSSTHTRAIGRPVPLAAARAVLPATIFGFAVPSILMFLPYANPHTHQGAIAFWQFVPVWVALLTNLGKRALEAVKPQGPFDVYEKRDVPVLQDAYKVAFWLSALMHVAFSAFVALTSLPTVTFANMFTDIPNPLKPWSAPNWEEHLFIFVKYDFAFSTLAILLWELYTVWELRRSGFATTKNAVAAAVAVLVGQVLVGPGAVYAGLWWWREGQLSGEARLEGRPDDVKAH
ncbi:FAD binding domain containing protein [Lasiodiplodia theobromae]|uniref:FAD-dependent monooxygenase andE n=1 Tax=Lasiodiplodia theobromae TaxID=45133 RepID=A0A5N5D682_9PEZI|nr:FAD binding domain containing protein [Lasiodiplodia theobromae]KAB2573273.1 FAD-dependent monooxygenase andE [Lasiodiplodia theobromae]KAF4543303.1 FAD binding domain containing protein [Lasiodiplodia theobromae]